LGKRPYDSVELGYLLARAYWKQGYAREACRAAVSHLFGQGVHRIYAECDPENEASWYLLERLGFEREAHLKQNVFFWKDGHGNPIWKDTYIYGKLNG
jgi:RimJ/RimL family protein N-acetyltransferase